jgi:magnesium-transporting ATPase (P-type)
MITGDQSVTALSIAKQIGIITHKTNIDLEKEGFTELEALHEANSISIEGRFIEQAFK